MKQNCAFAAGACAALFLAGCGGSKAETDAAREYVHKYYSNPGIDFTINQIDEPEYAAIAKIPRDHLASTAADRSAACGVRVKFTWVDGSRTTHDDWIVWLGSDHQPVGFTGNGSGDKWREFVQAAAKK